MKKHTLIVTLITAASIRVCFCQSPTPSPTVEPKSVCRLSSTDVELYGFYGTKQIVADRVANVPMKLSERRQFLQITQSGRTDSTADVKLFEKQEDGSFTVTEWKNVKAAGLFDTLERAIIDNKGYHCVGVACKDVLGKILGPGEDAGRLKADASPKEAFTPSVQDFISDDFGKSMLIFTC